MALDNLSNQNSAGTNVKNLISGRVWKGVARQVKSGSRDLDRVTYTHLRCAKPAKDEAKERTVRAIHYETDHCITNLGVRWIF
jgi:hypothetical protein